MSDDRTSQGPPTFPPRPEVSATRLVATLGLAGASAGLVLVVVFQATQPAIRRNKQAALDAAIAVVLNDPARVDTLYVRDGALSAEPPPDGKAPDRVWSGFDDDGRPVGFALVAGEPGFQDVVRLIFGYDPTSRTVLGMKVLESKETPGLGDKIEKDAAWVALFEGAEAPLVPVKAGGGTGDPREVDTITGATISSKAVIRIINHELERIGPLLERHRRGAGTADADAPEREETP